MAEGCLALHVHLVLRLPEKTREKRASVVLARSVAIRVNELGQTRLLRSRCIFDCFSLLSAYYNEC